MNEKSDYLLLFRDIQWTQHLSPDEIQKTMTEWMAWFDGLKAEGRCTGGQSLAPVGKVIAGPTHTISDGPYAEAKESVAGFFILHVADEAEAVEIGKQCPGLRYGTTVEVRPLLARCAASQRLVDAQAALSA